MSDTEESVFFSALLKRYPDPRIKESVDALPAPWQPLCAQAQKEVPLEQALTSYNKIVPLLHPSWKEEILSFLPNQVSQRISQMPKVLSHWLFEYGVCHSPLKALPDPRECQNSPLFFLVNASEKELCLLMELVVLFALMEAYLKIVDKKRLAKVSRLLTDRQKKWLAFLRLHPKRFSIEQIDLEQILAKEESVGRQALLDHGVVLFAKAVYGERDPVLQLIVHTLEMDLGKKVLTLVKEQQRTEEEVRKALSFVFECMKSRKGPHV